jgi:pimeloyl-ACP methyl ester carboxylesterase
MGLGGRAKDWGTAFPSGLSREYRVVRVDNRGTGGSAASGAAFTLEDLARDAVAVLDAVGADEAHVIGISMGGMIAQLLALDHPERVDRLVLLSTHFGGPGVQPPEPAALQLFDPKTFRERGRDPASMMRLTLSVISGPGFVERNPEAVEALAATAAEQPTRPNTFVGQFQAVVMSDRSERIRGLTLPTLVVHGTDDALIPVANGRNLAAAIPGAQLEVFEGCGHMPMWEEPEKLLRVVRAFLGSAGS